MPQSSSSGVGSFSPSQPVSSHEGPRARFEELVTAEKKGDGAARVMRATSDDLAYVVHLQKRHSRALGFVPREALAQKIDLGRIWLGTENDEPAGYLHHGSFARAEVRIFQAAVQYDARRRHLGLALVADFIARATAAGAKGISLRCLSFLEANEFWRAAGFELLTTEPGAGGALNVWTRTLSSASSSSQRFGADVAGNSRALNGLFHSRLHPCPRCGRQTVDTWTQGAVRHRLCPSCVAQTAATREVANGRHIAQRKRTTG